jgi:hypothetical protein
VHGDFVTLAPSVEHAAGPRRNGARRTTNHMKIKIIGTSGGYRNSLYHLEALPHVGEVLNLGNWQGTVAQVVHWVELYLPARCPSAVGANASRLASPRGATGAFSVLG